jgi:DNA polymerase III beta subunit
MKFSIPVSYAKKVVSLVRDVVPIRSVSQEAVGILVEPNIETKRVIFTAHGSDTLIRVSVNDADIVEEGRVVVNSALFSNIVSLFSPADNDNVGTGNLTIETVKKNNVVQITSRTTYRGNKSVNNKRLVPLLNAELFPSIQKYSGENSSELPGIIFRDAIDRTAPSVSPSHEAGAISGIYLHAENGEFCAVSTDGVRLAEYKAKLDDPNVSFTAVVPLKFAIKASRAIDPSEMIKIVSSDNIFWISSPGVLVGGVVLRGEFPDYKSFLLERKLEATIDRKLFLDNVRNIDFAGNAEDESATLKFSKDKLTVFNTMAENESIDVSFEEDFEIAFNIKLLKSVVSLVGGQTISIGLSSSSGPAYFYSKDFTVDTGIEFTSVLMPIRM